jgi:glucoamylase
MPRDLPIGNGTVLINFDRNYNLRDIYFPHVGEENHTIGHVSRFGVYADGDFSWIGPEWQIEKKYLPETLVTQVVLRSEKLGLELTVHDAVEFHLWAYIRQIVVRDLRGQKRDVRLFFHHDFHISESDVGDTAFYDPRTQSLIHYKKERWFLINTTDGTSTGLQQWATGTKECCGFEGTWRDAEDGQLGGNPIAQGSVDSTVGLSLSVPPLSEMVAHYWMCFGVNYDKVVKLNSIIVERTPQILIRRTESYWRLWVNKDNMDFQNLPDSIVQLFKQSLLIMRTQIDDGGAIIAANDYDIAQFARDTYSYMWPRDGALVADALTRAGYREAGQRFFNFCLDVIKEDGYLMHKYNPDRSVASSWHPWFKDRHFDLPIQEDETALVLWSLWHHFKKFRDVEFIKPLFRRLISNAANFLVKYRDPETKLPLPSYDLWEERWGVHLFTVAAVIGGLTAAANFARLFGETELSQSYAQSADDMREAMNKHLWSEPHQRFARMATRTTDGYTLDMTIDASGYALFAFGALPVVHPRMSSHMEAVRDRLTVQTQVGGIARYEDDYYHQVSKDIAKVPGNPWFICTMWLAQYDIALATTLPELQKGLQTLQWVADHALPSGVLAEQVDPYTNEPLSVSPLTWSHACFVTCVLEYLSARQKMISHSVC